MRGVAAVCLLAMLVIVGCGGGDDDNDTAVERIAFERGDPTSPSVLVSNADGTGQQTIISDARDPALRRDGQAVAFARGPDIFLVNVNGTGLTNLTNNNSLNAFASSPAYSQFADRIAYVLTPTDDDGEEGVPTVRLMDADGSDDVLLVTGGDEPSFDPSGGRIAFVSGPDLFLIRTNGTDLVQLTFHDTNLEAHSPSFSPFGDRIIFELSPSPSIFTIGTDGRGETELVDSGADPSVNQFGNRIAFARGGSIFSTNIIGTDQRQLTSGPDDRNPSWSGSL